MRCVSVALMAMCCLAACGSKPAPPATSRTISPAASAKTAPTPARSGGTRFEGTVGQLEDGGAFIRFIADHEKQVVTLDVQFPADSFQGGEDGESAFFVVWEDCDNLPEGQKPNEMACTGFEYNVPKAASAERPLVQEGGVWRLRGQFKIVNAGGPLQGQMMVRLEPVPKQTGGAE